MKDYYNLFVELSLKQCNINDYADKAKVKAHNEASRKLNQLQSEMNPNGSKEILYMLLAHEDNRVKINAASYCLQKGIMVDQAASVLKKIIDISQNEADCFSAKMLLHNLNSTGDGSVY